MISLVSLDVLSHTILIILLDTSDHDVKKCAKELNVTAKELYIQENFSETVSVYTNAIQLNPSSAYYVNRSLANLKLRICAYALEDATQGIQIDQAYAKGYSRRGDAHMALEQ